MNTIKEPVSLGYKCNHKRKYSNCKSCKHDKPHYVRYPYNASSCTHVPCAIPDATVICVEVFET